MRKNHGLDQQDFDLEGLSLANEQEQSYNVELITPMYGGGVEAGEIDKGMPFRAAEIRGQLRYWWRFIIQHHPDSTIRIDDQKALYILEQSIWGGLNTSETQSPAVASKVQISVSGFRKGTEIECCDYEKKVNHAGSELLDEYGNPKYHLPSFLPEIEGDKESLGYCLFPGQGKPPPRRVLPGDEPVFLYAPPCGFLLTLSVIPQTTEKSVIEILPEEDWALVLEAVRWWNSFGGLGARTRRGAGSIIIDGLSNISKEEATQYGCDLRIHNKSYEHAVSAWNQSIGKLKHFRQGVGLGRNSGNGNIPGRSKWPEPDSIREIARLLDSDHKPEHKARVSFPRAAFGMPIIFEFKGSGEPCTSILNEKGKNRMASPLILKAIKINQEYRAIVINLPSASPTEIVLEGYQTNSLNTDHKPDDIEEGQWNDSIDWSKKWWRESLSEKVVPIERHNGVDAISSFLNFFEKN